MIDTFSKNSQLELVPPRVMTKEAMKNDFEYNMVQKLSERILKERLISLDEYTQLFILNRDTFNPFMSELLA